jgi:asparagine synthase (glutamine-hydrolysing)
MCGIAGYYQFESKTFEEVELHKMAQTTAHRGPDSTGFFSDEIVGLAHNRLSIIDLHNEANQPMLSNDGNSVIIYNGEIYNYDELRREYQIDCKTTSDTEIVLELLCRKDVDAISLFNGMFAIALYNKSETSLLLIRDRMGVKPLFYYWDGKHFAFASEIKALLALDFINSTKSIRKESINEFLHLGYVPEPHTIWKNIFKFPSGSYARLKDGVFTIQQYWNLEDSISNKTITNENEARENLRDLLVSSVRYRLKSDVPFGTFLSGGIDSSLVTAIAQQQLSKPLNTFSIAFPDSNHNEAGYAKAVADYLKTNHTELAVREKDVLELVESMLQLYDEPFSDSSALPTMIVSKLARQKVTMTLSGDGGDELFMGYGMYNWAERLQNPYLKFGRKPLSLGLSMLSSRHKRIGQVLNYGNDDVIKSHIFSQEQYLFHRKDISKILNKEYVTDIVLQENYKNHNRQLTVKEEQAFFDLHYYLIDDLLVKVDRASMFYSLETRVPLLDYTVVEYALNIDQSLKVKNGVSKYILKQVLYDYVPASFFDRPKWGFSIPLVKWLRSDLRYLVEEYLSESKIKEFGVLNLEAVNKLKHLFYEKHVDYLYNRIWQLIVLQSFLQRNGQ